MLQIDQVVAVKPKIDNRYAVNRIISHEEAQSHEKNIGILAQVIDQDNPDLISLLTPKTSLLALDEANFFKFESLNKEIQDVLNRGIDVIAVGLIYDAFKQEFGATKKLLAIADKPIVITAKCYKCGGIAPHTKRLTQAKDQLVVGGADIYQPSCENCFSL